MEIFEKIREEFKGLGQKYLYEYIDKDRKDWISIDYIGISTSAAGYGMGSYLRSRLINAGFKIYG